MNLEGASVKTIDASSRVALRDDQVDEFDGAVILTQGFDGQLLVFTRDQWEDFREELSGGSQMDPDLDDLRRLFIAPATKVELDDRGRMKIPAHLREWADLRPGESRVILLNLGPRHELWLQSKYDTYLKERAADLKRIARKRFGAGDEEDEVEA